LSAVSLNTPLPKVEEVAEESKELIHVGEVEQSPADHDDKEGVDVAEYRGELVEEPAEDELLENQEKAVVESPENEVVGGSVPESRQPPDDKKVDDLTANALAVAAERNVNVLLEPR